MLRAEPGTAAKPMGIDSQQWQRVMRDPFIQQVKEAVDGTLTSVRPISRRVPGDDPDSARGNESG